MPDPVAEALEELHQRDAARRLHDRDATLFSDDVAVQAKVADRLGWIPIAANPAGPDGWSERVMAFAARVRGDGFTEVVLAGMGGSSLAPEVLAEVGRHGSVADRSPLHLRILDSTHPDAVRAALDDADLATTLVIVASKSGGTEETRDFGAHAARLVPSPRHLVAITDPGSALEQEAREGGWREVFTNPPDIGGRYSALSLFGMVPAALVGLDLTALWTAGAAALDACGEPDLSRNPGAQLAAFAGGHARAGRDKLTLLLPDALEPLGDWVEQLVAESTGKHGRGIIPIVGEPPGDPASYGDDRAFVAVSHGDVPAPAATVLRAAGFPVHDLAVTGTHDLGAAFVVWEVATALAGVALGVNPFDEPNVAESKANTARVLEEIANAPDAAAALLDPGDDDLAALLDDLRPGDYLSIQAYLPRTAATIAALQQLRTTVRDARKVATTVGFGPRFLHSTGQLHKGGPNSCVALQIVDRVHGGPTIPGRHFDFATLIRAQSAGDLQSLRAHGRRAARVTVEGVAGLENLVSSAPMIF